MVVVVAEHRAGPDVQHLEPTGWKGGHGDLEFPPVVEAGGLVWLDIDPGARDRFVAVDREYFVGHGVDDVVRDLAEMPSQRGDVL